MSAQRRGFTIGVMHAAWWLSYAHGETTYADELLLELGLSVATLQRLASDEQFTFKRGYWSELKRKQRRADCQCTDRTPGRNGLCRACGGFIRRAS